MSTTSEDRVDAEAQVEKERRWEIFMFSIEELRAEIKRKEEDATKPPAPLTGVVSWSQVRLASVAYVEYLHEHSMDYYSDYQEVYTSLWQSALKAVYGDEIMVWMKERQKRIEKNRIDVVLK